MANYFRQTAETLREIAESSDTLCRLTLSQREDLKRAALVLCRLEQIKRDLIASDSGDDAASERLSLDLIAMLGLHTGS